MQKLYIIVRADLAPGLFVAQACHAVSAFACAHPVRHFAWHTGGRNIVVLSVPDGAALDRLHALATEAGVDAAAFYETDLGFQTTAVALAGDAKKFVTKLPLALKAPRLAA